MYDKFYELAAKAGIDIHTKPFSKDQTEYFHGDRAEFLYEFAELIVRECCDWIDGSPANDAGQLHLTKSFIIANLKGMFRGSKE